MPKHTYTHWFTFDTRHAARVRKTIVEGKRILIVRAYNHPSDGRLAVIEVQSTDPYLALELDTNSLSSPLRHQPRKPAGLGRGMPVDVFERIYGAIT